MIKIDPPHITGGSLYEQVQQLIRYQHRLAEQLNVEINRDLDELRQPKEE